MQFWLLLVFALAALISYCLTPAVRRVARAIGALDEVDHRKIHTEPVPRLGGLAVIIGAFAASFFAARFGPTSTTGLPGVQQTFDFLLPLVPIVLLGIYDDIKGANATKKLIVQALAAAFAFWLGFRVNLLTNPFGDQIILGQTFSLVTTVGWLMLTTNAVNLIDGMDGLATGVSLFAATTIFILSLLQGNWVAALLSAALGGALAGFLPYNFRPASIFLGDVGSLTLGFMLGMLAVIGSQKSATAIAIAVPILALGIPVADTLLSVVRRAVRGRPIFEPDQDHLHHRLLELGLGVKQAVFVLYVGAAVFGALSLLVASASSAVAGPIVLVLAALAWLLLRQMGYDELRVRRVVRNLAARTSDRDRMTALRESERRLRPPASARSALLDTGAVFRDAECEALMYTPEGVSLAWLAGDTMPVVMGQSDVVGFLEESDSVSADFALADGCRTRVLVFPRSDWARSARFTLVGVLQGVLKPALSTFSSQDIAVAAGAPLTHEAGAPAT
jgi:UDP-GlcNAc:undecaprenyl-phosphate GlcNAc-1-phosphate transferase